MSESSEKNAGVGVEDWKRIVAKFQEPSLPRAIWQMINTFGSYALLWWAMYVTLPISWWFVVPLAILAG